MHFLDKSHVLLVGSCSVLIMLVMYTRVLWCYRIENAAKCHHSINKIVWCNWHSNFMTYEVPPPLLTSSHIPKGNCVLSCFATTGSYIRMRIRIGTHTYSYAYTYAYTYACICTHTHIICICICVGKCVCMCIIVCGHRKSTFVKSKDHENTFLAVSRPWCDASFPKFKYKLF